MAARKALFLKFVLEGITRIIFNLALRQALKRLALWEWFSAFQLESDALCLGTGCKITAPSGGSVSVIDLSHLKWGIGEASTPPKLPWPLPQ